MAQKEVCLVAPIARKDTAMNDVTYVNNPRETRAEYLSRQPFPFVIASLASLFLLCLVGIVFGASIPTFFCFLIFAGATVLAKMNSIPVKPSNLYCLSCDTPIRTNTVWRCGYSYHCGGFRFGLVAYPNGISQCSSSHGLGHERRTSHNNQKACSSWRTSICHSRWR